MLYFLEASLVVTMDRLKLISLHSALLFLIVLSAILIFKSFLHIFNINPYYISQFISYISIALLSISVLSTASLIFFSDKDATYFVGNAILAGVIIATFYFTYIFDYSWDGMAYHLPSILLLKEGWNPIRDPNVSLILTNSYPNGFWSLSAIYGEILGSHEYGKAINGCLAIIFSVLSIHVVDSIQKNLDRVLALITLNCVFVSNVICQFFGNYLDGTIYILFLLFIIVFLSFKEKINSNYCFTVLSSILIILINTKTSGLYFGFIAVILYLVILFNKEQGKFWGRILNLWPVGLKLGSASIVIGILLVGWRPWITNIIEHNSVFYPDPHGTIASMAPSNLKDYDIFKNITYAIYGYHSDAIPPDSARLKSPFSVDRSEFHVAPLGPRSGGFGPLFGAILTIALILRVFTFFYYKLKFNNLDYLSIIIFCGCALLPGAWWARFIPMVYFIPILIILRILDLKLLFSRITSMVFILLFIINFVPTIIFYQHLSAYALYVDNTFQSLRDNKAKIVVFHSDPFGDINSMSHIVWSKRLAARSIPHRITRDKGDCAEEILVSAFVSICRDKA